MAPAPPLTRSPTAPPTASATAPAPALARRAVGVGSSRIRELLRLVERPGVLSMAGGLPAPSALGVERVRAAALEAFEAQGSLGATALQYGPTEGVTELRALLAAQHGVEIDQVLVTTGSQQAIDLLARTLADAGDVVVAEAPSYLGALQSFAAAELRVSTIDGDEDGFDVDALEAAHHGDASVRPLLDQDAARRPGGLRPRFVYVVANFHNPTGTVLPPARRRRLAELSRAHGFWVIEDDPYGELRFDAGAPPSIAASPGAGASVIRLGSASKVLAPGLRVGWMVGPRAVIEAATRLKQAADLHTPGLNQLVVASLLRDAGAQAAHLERIRALYATRAAALHTSLTRHLGDRVRVQPARGGMFLWATATDGTDTEALLDRAIAHGVAYVPGTAFAPDGGRFRSSMRLSFATLDADQLDEAVGRLATVWTTDRTPTAR